MSITDKSAVNVVLLIASSTDQLYVDIRHSVAGVDVGAKVPDLTMKPARQPDPTLIESAPGPRNRMMKWFSRLRTCEHEPYEVVQVGH